MTKVISIIAIAISIAAIVISTGNYLNAKENHKQACGAYYKVTGEIHEYCVKYENNKD